MAFCTAFFIALEKPLPDGSDVRTPPLPKIIIGSKYREAFLRASPFLLTGAGTLAVEYSAEILVSWIMG
jgi:hypothetical protein